MPVVFIGEGLDVIDRIYMKTNQGVYDRYLVQHPGTVEQPEDYPCLNIVMNSSTVVQCEVVHRPLGSIHDFTFYLKDNTTHNITVANVFAVPKIYSIYGTYRMVFSSVHLRHYWIAQPPNAWGLSGEITLHIEDVDLEVEDWDCSYEADIELGGIKDQLTALDEEVTIRMVALDEVATLTFKNPFYKAHISATTTLVLIIIGVFTCVGIVVSIYVWRRRKSGLDSTYSRVNANDYEVELQEGDEKKEKK